MAEDLVKTGLEVEKLSRAVETGHHRLERVLLVQETVLVRHDDSIGRQSKIGGHVLGNSGRWDRRLGGGGGRPAGGAPAGGRARAPPPRPTPPGGETPKG